MLDAAGVPLLVDGLRAPDEDNPRGYFEYERVKALPRDNAWLELARGRALKVVYPLLRFLPAGHAYRVLFMERAASEVIRSQNSILRRHGSVELASDDVAESARVLEAELCAVRAWLAGHAVLSIPHRALFADPLPLLREVCAFLGLPDCSQLMAARIEPTLYRSGINREAVRR
jgi:hypothetical protein